MLTEDTDSHSEGFTSVYFDVIEDDNGNEVVVETFYDYVDLGEVELDDGIYIIDYTDIEADRLDLYINSKKLEDTYDTLVIFEELIVYLPIKLIQENPYLVLEIEKRIYLQKPPVYTMVLTNGDSTCETNVIHSFSKTLKELRKAENGEMRFNIVAFILNEETQMIEESHVYSKEPSASLGIYTELKKQMGYSVYCLKESDESILNNHHPFERNYLIEKVKELANLHEDNPDK